MPLRAGSVDDRLAIEATPWESRRPARSTYELLTDVMHAAPDRIALTELPSGNPDDGDIRITRRDLMHRITQAANLFHALELRTSESVAMLLSAGIDAHVAILGAQAAGIAAPINPMLQTDEIEHLVRLGKSRVLVASSDPATGIWPKAQELARRMPDLKVLTVGPAQPGIDGFTDACALQSGDGLAFTRVIQPADIAAFIHTGGTTGTPKLARLTHDNFIYGAWAQARLWNFNEDDVILSALPLFHVSGLGALGMVPLGVGAEVVVLSPTGFRNPEVVRNFWRIVERYRGSFSAFVPTVAHVLSTVAVDTADLASLRTIMIGGAAAPVDTLRRLSEQAGSARIVVTYGQTECLVGTGSVPGEPANPMSSGAVAPYMRLDIRSPEKPEAHRPKGEVGLVVLKGPAVFDGYEGQLANEGFTADGWLISGDLGWLDEGGSFYVAGRTRDLIIRSGHNIDPRMIEEAGATHPAVASCAAVGAPDRYAGELPVLYVTLRSGAHVEEDDLVKWIAERVSERPAAPKQVHIVDSLPTTAVGKLYKPPLRLDAAERVARQELVSLVTCHKVVGVEAIAHDRLGIVIVVTVGADFEKDQKLASEIADLLSGYLFHHTVEIATAPVA